MTVFDNVRKIKSIDVEKERNWRVENNTPSKFAEDLIFEGYGLMMIAERETHPPRGRPRLYPDAMIIWGMKILEAFKIGYRGAAGVMRGVLKGSGIRCPSPSQFFHRAREIFARETRIDVTDARVLAKGIGPMRPSMTKRITVAVDSTGVRPSAAGEWLAERYDGKRQRGWIKFHCAVDIDTNEILAFVITTEECGDNSCFMMLVDMVLEAGHMVERIYADAAYDAKDNWWLKNRGIKFISNIRKNTTGNFNGCSPRGLQALRRNEIGEKAWKIEVGYGRRWKVECTFSDFKRILLETLRARDRHMMAAELYWKVLTFDQYKLTRRELAGME